jgi:hypothetical protein
MITIKFIGGGSLTLPKEQFVLFFDYFANQGMSEVIEHLK